MKSRCAWRSSPVFPSEQFEARLEAAVEAFQGESLVRDMLAYHFGYGEYGNVRRGKRLRPRLLLEVVENEGGAWDDALDAAAAIEILHNYSLVHDDIEDHDRLRHGRETLWAKYGIPQAVNAGDAMCALAFLELTRAHIGFPAERCLHLVHALHTAHLEMCDGQSL